MEFIYLKLQAFWRPLNSQQVPTCWVEVRRDVLEVWISDNISYYVSTEHQFLLQHFKAIIKQITQLILSTPVFCSLADNYIVLRQSHDFGFCNLT